MFCFIVDYNWNMDTWIQDRWIKTDTQPRFPLQVIDLVNSEINSEIYDIEFTELWESGLFNF